MKNIKEYSQHLKESEEYQPQKAESLNDLWVVYFQEDYEYHFIAAYEDSTEASSRFIEEADDWHGDAIYDKMQDLMDDDPEKYGKGWTPSEIEIRDPDAYADLWTNAIDFVQTHQEEQDREYSYQRLKHVEDDIISSGGKEDLGKFIMEMAESEETPEWARELLIKRQRSTKLFGRG